MTRWKPTRKADENMNELNRNIENYSMKTDEKMDTFLQTKIQSEHSPMERTQPWRK